METAIALRDVERIPATLDERKKATDLTIDTATYWAKKLVKVVEDCGMSKNVGGKKYLQVEAWQLIGEFAHVTPVIEWCREWKDGDGQLIGYEARAKLVQEGVEVGAGESSCGIDAFPCRGKQGSEKDKAARSAAQTWAISRALRNKFSYVALLGGYQSTPAEEMHNEEERMAPRQPPESGPPQPLVISDAQRKRLWAMCQSATPKVSDAQLKAHLIKEFSINSTAAIRRSDYEEICRWVQKPMNSTNTMGREPGSDDIPDFPWPDKP